jgi:hypothetical protein
MASQAKEAIAAHATKPAACSKIGPHALQREQVFFPFHSVHASRMNGLRIGLQRGLTGKHSTREVLVEDVSTLIQTGPHISMRRVGLFEPRWAVIV